jgi:hypothetical protein
MDDRRVKEKDDKQLKRFDGWRWRLDGFNWAVLAVLAVLTVLTVLLLAGVPNGEPQTYQVFKGERKTRF